MKNCYLKCYFSIINATIIEKSYFSFTGINFFIGFYMYIYIYREFLIIFCKANFLFSFSYKLSNINKWYINNINERHCNVLCGVRSPFSAICWTFRSFAPMICVTMHFYAKPKRCCVEYISEYIIDVWHMPLSTDNFFEISLNARLKKHTTDTATTQGFKIK